MRNSDVGQPGAVPEAESSFLDCQAVEYLAVSVRWARSSVLRGALLADLVIAVMLS